MGLQPWATLLSYLDTHGVVVLNEILTIRLLTFTFVSGKDITLILLN
jgi:hypothetical protein